MTEQQIHRANLEWYDQNHYIEIAMGRLSLQEWARVEQLIKEEK